MQKEVDNTQLRGIRCHEKLSIQHSYSEVHAVIQEVANPELELMVFPFLPRQVARVLPPLEDEPSLLAIKDFDRRGASFHHSSVTRVEDAAVDVDTIEKLAEPPRSC